MAGSVANVKDLPALSQALATHTKVVVHFWAAWCEPCKFLDTVLQQLLADQQAVAVARVEAEEVPDVSEQYGVTVVPSFFFFRDAMLVDKLEGADAAALTAKFTELAGSSGSAAANGTATDAAAHTAGQPSPSGLDAELNARLKQLVGQRSVMLFMKGTPEAPRCGFSRRVVEALNDAGAEFGHFDILSDEAVRQGLKTFSNWPTFPQLYVNGELLGGCDIVLEMAQTGELKEALGQAAEAAGGSKEALNLRLERLVKQQPLMLFMKGTPDAPKCGFSRKVVEALRAAGEEFGYFNILSDEDVRQGLKDFSNWPTYPQLFVNGELLGGCDIVLEMAASGELSSTIAEMKEIS